MTSRPSTCSCRSSTATKAARAVTRAAFDGGDRARWGVAAGHAGPVLSGAQRRAGRELGSLSAVADSEQTLLCTYLSGVLLLGLLLNSLFGWSWADPVVALIIGAVAVREGLQAWRPLLLTLPPPRPPELVIGART